MQTSITKTRHATRRAGFLLDLERRRQNGALLVDYSRETDRQRSGKRRMGRNEIALTVLGTALLFTADAAQTTPRATTPSNANNAAHGAASSPRRAAMPVNHHRAQYLRSAQRKSTEEKRLILERAAKMKRQSVEKVDRLAEQAKSQLGMNRQQQRKQEAPAAKVGSATTTTMSSSSSSSSSSSPSHVKVHVHSAPKESELEEADEFDSFNPLDLFASLEGTKKTPFEKQTTSSGEVVENAVLSKKDKLSSVFATMLGSMMEVSRGVDESTGATASSNNSCVKATRNVAVTCFREYSAISADVKAGKLTAEESAEQMELLRETCADKSRVINTQCVKPIAEMCSSQVQEIKKECAKGIVGSEELTLNMALDSASAAAQQCATQASALLKSCMKQSKTLSPDLKELAMIDSKAEEKALEMKKEKEIQDKVNESMRDLSFSSSSSSFSSSSSSSATATEAVEPTLASQDEEEDEEYKVVKATEEPISSVVSSETAVPQPGEQVDVVTTSEPEIVAGHHSSSLSTMKLPVVTEEVDEVEPAEIESAEAAVPTTATTQSHATVQTLSVPRPVTTTTTSTTTIEGEEEQQPELTEEEQAVEEEADSGCAGALSKVTADCQLTYKQINDKVKSGELEEAAGKDQIAVAARQCVAKTMLATSSCVDKVQRRRLMSLAK